MSEIHVQGCSLKHTSATTGAQRYWKNAYFWDTW